MHSPRLANAWQQKQVNYGVSGVGQWLLANWHLCDAPASLSSFGQLPAQIRMEGVTELSSATSFGRVISVKSTHHNCSSNQCPYHHKMVYNSEEPLTSLHGKENDNVPQYVNHSFYLSQLAHLAVNHSNGLNFKRNAANKFMQSTSPTI